MLVVAIGLQKFAEILQSIFLLTLAVGKCCCVVDESVHLSLAIAVCEDSSLIVLHLDPVCAAVSEQAIGQKVQAQEKVSFGR